MTIFIIVAIIVFVIIIYVSHKSESHEEVQKELAAKYVSDNEVLTNAVGFLTKSEALRQSEIMGDDKTHSAILENTYKGPWPESRGGDGWLSIYDDLRILNLVKMAGGEKALAQIKTNYKPAGREPDGKMAERRATAQAMTADDIIKAADNAKKKK